MWTGPIINTCAALDSSKEKQDRAHWTVPEFTLSAGELEGQSQCLCADQARFELALPPE